MFLVPQLESLQNVLELLQLLQKLFLLLQKLFLLLLELLLVFFVKFLLLEKYMLSPYIILVSNRLVS